MKSLSTSNAPVFAFLLAVLLASTPVISADALTGEYNLLLRVGEIPDHTYQGWFTFEVTDGATVTESTAADWTSHARSIYLVPVNESDLAADGLPTIR